MAGGAIIGALRVVIGADSAALDKGLKDAQSSLTKFSASMKNVGLVAAGALAGAVGGAAVALRNALKDADKLGKLAQSVGLPVAELSKLKHAAELSDISLESLGTSLVRLSRNMSEVAGGNTTGAAAQAFKVLGISVRDASGQVKSSDTILGEVADRFAQFKDGANKTALAVALFGRAGAEMIPMLNQGSAAIRAAKDEAEQLGLVIDSKTAAAAENFNDNLTRLGRVMSGVFTQLAAQLAPELSRLSTIFVQIAKDGNAVKAMADLIGSAFSRLTQIVMTVSLAFNRLGAEWTALREFLQTDIFSGKLGEAWQKFTDVAKESQRQFATLRATFEDDWIGTADAAMSGLGKSLQDNVNKPLRDAPALASGATNALQTYLTGIEKRKAALHAEIQTIGMSEAAQESARIRLEALTIAKEKNIAVTDAMRAKIEQAASSFGQLSQAVQEARQRWQFVENSINTVASGLTDIVMRTKTAGEAFREMALSIIRDFTQMIIKAQLLRAATAFMEGFGGGTGGSILAIAGARAGGGPVVGGMPYLVGERGPEIMVPGSSGQIIPNNQIGMGGINIVQHNDFRGVDPSQRAYIAAQIRMNNAQLRQQVLADVSSQNRDRPGYLSK